MKRKTKPRTSSGKTKAILKSKRKSSAKKKSPRILKSKSKKNQEKFELDNFLVDEQISYSKKVKRVNFKPVINELDKLIEGEKMVSNFRELLPQNELKVSLDSGGQVISKSKSHHVSNSAYLIDLKNNKKKAVKSNQKPKGALESFFTSSYNPSANFKKSAKEIDDHTDNYLEVPSPSLLAKKSFIDRLDNFGTKIYQYLPRFKFLKPKKTTSHKKTHYLTANNPLGNLRLALNFALIALLLIVPIRGMLFYKHVVKTKGQVLGVSEIALTEFKEGAEAAIQLDWQQAGFNFSSASSYFAEAQRVVEQYNKNLLDFLKIIPATGKRISAAQDLLEAGKYLTKAAEDLSQVFLKSQEVSNLNQALTDGLVVIQQGLEEVVLNIEEAVTYLSKLEASVMPEEYQDYFIQMQASLPQLQSSLVKSQEMFSFALEILGHQKPKRYLLMFQNPYELRATGGFFGSHAIMDLKKGEIVNLEVPGGGTYDLKGYFTKKVISPEPMHLVGSSWQIWDVNWFADFEASAKKISWFLENASGPSVDGVIAINATVIPSLLEVVGDIEMPEYDKVLTPENVVLALQHATLFEYDPEENKPKAIIGDMMPILLERLLALETEQTLPMFVALHKALAEKEIQFYFPDSQLQKQADDFGWTGKILPAEHDYLMVVDSNIAGGKTNAYISEQINHYAYLQEDGGVINTVSITRQHDGHLYDVDDANYVFARDNNVSYLRLYVPAGAELLEVSGYNPPADDLYKEVYPNFVEDDYLKSIEGEVIIDQETGTRISNEFGKTVFGNWIQVEPGLESTLTFSYRLPSLKTESSNMSKLFSALGKNETFDYSLLAQRQSGVRDVAFKSFLFLPENIEIKWLNSTSDSQLNKTQRGAEFSTELTTDQYYAVILSDK